jgi:hypothetical protein
MVRKPRSPLAKRISTAAGILLLVASLTEAAGAFGESGHGIGPGTRLVFALVAAAVGTSVLLRIRYAVYAALPVALAIFFCEVYRTASATVSLFSILAGVSFFAAALFAFMLVRADKT